MTPEVLVKEIRASKEYLDRSTRVLTEEDSAFQPADEMLTVAQQMAHIAQTVDWFIEGAFGKGFDMDFDDHLAKIRAVKSLADARAWVDKAYGRLVRTIESRTAEDLLTPIENQPIMPGEPKLSIVYAIAEHTAHHRGALTVYSRLRGHTPSMPYMETAPASS